ncbi:MAG: tripartite tricarboxylate transporter substrate binding protein [Deltaproteobacteria bacterium]|nr:tripartite tricarboxylate transporter substrate binding protein [Deltaproteobacteria bacterium]
MKKQFFAALLLAVTVFALPLNAQAADYPVRAIKGIVPYGAGGSTDVVFRAIAAEAEKYLGQPIAIVNKKGAGGSVGGNFVAKSRPDGYTILLAPTSVVDIYPHLASEPAYVLGDLIPVCVVTVDPRVFVVRSEAPWNTVKDLIEAAKKSPGTIRFGSPGVTSWGAFGYYALQAVYPDVKFLPVPLRGHSDIVTAMLRGDVDVASGTFAGYKAQVDARKFKPIGIASDTRSEFLPDVPTCKEVGVDMPQAPNIRYVWVPKGTPMSVQKKLEGAFKAMSESPVVIKRIKTLNQNLEFHGREEAMKIAKAESEHFKGLIKKFGLKVKKKK